MAIQVVGAPGEAVTLYVSGCIHTIIALQFADLVPFCIYVNYDCVLQLGPLKLGNSVCLARCPLFTALVGMRLTPLGS